LWAKRAISSLLLEVAGPSVTAPPPPAQHQNLDKLNSAGFYKNRQKNHNFCRLALADIRKFNFCQLERRPMEVNVSFVGSA
jgi:hypothetical protein